jgi:hypothetical protein
MLPKGVHTEGTPQELKDLLNIGKPLRARVGARQSQHLMTSTH